MTIDSAAETAIAKRRPTWDQRIANVKRQFPSVERLNWKVVFDLDPVLLGKIVADVIKADQSEPGRPGKRAAVAADIAATRLRQMTGDDYTILPFSEAFRALAANRSVRQLAHRLDMDRNHVYRLLTGAVQPTGTVMEKVADSFNKSAGYFPEYRAAYIAAGMLHRLETIPEASVFLFRKLQGIDVRDRLADG